MRAPLRLLTIAGSDSGGGAGIQADLKTFSALGTYGMSVITAITAQNTREVRAVAAVEASLVAAQIDAVWDDIGVDALKIGMLHNADIAATVADRLDAHPPAPSVLDPVMVAKSGAMLLEDDAVAVVCSRLIPRATVVTPNLPEAERLTGISTTTPTGQADAARALVRMGAAAALVKGGHGAGDTVVDLLFDGRRFHRFARARVVTTSDHGTGCTLSAALAVFLARDLPLPEAVERAGDYLHGALQEAFPLGGGRGPVNHFHRGRGGGQ